MVSEKLSGEPDDRLHALSYLLYKRKCTSNKACLLKQGMLYTYVFSLLYMMTAYCCRAIIAWSTEQDMSWYVNKCSGELSTHYVHRKSSQHRIAKYSSYIASVITSLCCVWVYTFDLLRILLSPTETLPGRKFDPSHNLVCICRPPERMYRSQKKRDLAKKDALLAIWEPTYKQPSLILVSWDVPSCIRILWFF